MKKFILVVLVLIIILGVGFYLYTRSSVSKTAIYWSTLSFSKKIGNVERPLWEVLPVKIIYESSYQMCQTKKLIFSFQSCKKIRIEPITTFAMTDSSGRLVIQSNTYRNLTVEQMNEYLITVLANIPGFKDYKMTDGDKNELNETIKTNIGKNESEIKTSLAGFFGLMTKKIDNGDFVYQTYRKDFVDNAGALISVRTDYVDWQASSAKVYLQSSIYKTGEINLNLQLINNKEIPIIIKDKL